MATLRKFIKLFTPPMFFRIRDYFKHSDLEYLPPGSSFTPSSTFNDEHFIERQIRHYHYIVSAKFERNLGGMGDQAKYLILQEVARNLSVKKTKLKVLDYGGAFGAHYHIIKAATSLPVEYTVVEVRDMCAKGREINPGVMFTEKAPNEHFDLVILSSLLQYIDDWKEFLKSFDAEKILFSKTVITNGPSFDATQQMGHGRILYHIRNEKELSNYMVSLGYRLEREYVETLLNYGGMERVKNAPTPTQYVCWLYRK